MLPRSRGEVRGTGRPLYMSAFVFGPHILTNTTLPGRPFSATFRASVKKNGVQRDQTGRVLRDESGRLRLDLEYQGIHVGFSVLDPVAGLNVMVNDINKAYVESALGTPIHCGMPDPNSEKRIIEGLECLRYPPAPSLEEAWVSPELEFVIRERVRDETHESTWELFDIVRGEPDAGLFQIPPGYRRGEPSTDV